MRKIHVLLLPVLFLVGLAACGGGGSSSGEESGIEEAIERAATAENPADCTKYQTYHFLEQTNQAHKRASVKSCRKEAESDEGAESAEVSNIEVNGSEASAEVALTGGNLNGQALEVLLVQEGNQWKLNEVVKFTSFNQAKLIESFERQLSTSKEFSPEFATCFVKILEGDDQGQIEQFLFGDLSSNGKALGEIARECA